MLALLWDDDDDPNVALAAAKPKVVVGKRRGAVLSDSEQGDKGTTIKAA